MSFRASSRMGKQSTRPLRTASSIEQRKRCGDDPTFEEILREFRVSHSQQEAR